MIVTWSGAGAREPDQYPCPHPETVWISAICRKCRSSFFWWRPLVNKSWWKGGPTQTHSICSKCPWRSSFNAGTWRCFHGPCDCLQLICVLQESNKDKLIVLACSNKECEAHLQIILLSNQPYIQCNNNLIYDIIQLNITWYNMVYYNII